MNSIRSRISITWLATAATLAPLLVMGGLVVAGVAASAWATGRTTLYTVTNQRVLMQYGVALTATLALPMRLIGAVSVSEGRVGNVPIRLKPGAVVQRRSD